MINVSGPALLQDNSRWTGTVINSGVAGMTVDEPACKPGPVPGRLTAIPFGDHPSRRTVAGTL